MKKDTSINHETNFMQMLSYLLSAALFDEELLKIGFILPIKKDDEFDKYYTSIMNTTDEPGFYVDFFPHDHSLNPETIKVAIIKVLANSNHSKIEIESMLEKLYVIIWNEIT